MRKRNLFLLTAAAAAVAAACAAPPDEKRNINLKGSDTMLQLGQRWAGKTMWDAAAAAQDDGADGEWAD